MLVHFILQQELFDFTEQCYIDFIPLLTSSEQIASKLSNIKSEINNLQISLETMVMQYCLNNFKFVNFDKVYTVKKCFSL